MISWPLIRYVLTAARRDRLFWSIPLVALVGTCLSLFLGSAAIAGQGQFSLVFMAASLRMAGVAGITLFVVFYIRRAFDSRDIDFLLARPITRTSFIVSLSAAFSFLAVLAALCIILPVAFTAAGQGTAGLFLWALSIVAEFIIVANAALFFSMVLSSATTGVLAVFGLYILARLMGELLGIIITGSHMPGFDILAIVMQAVSLIVPRLDLFAQSTWLVYGAGDAGAGFILLQCVLYSALLIAATLVDFVRRQF